MLKMMWKMANGHDYDTEYDYDDRLSREGDDDDSDNDDHEDNCCEYDDDDDDDDDECGLSG